MVILSYLAVICVHSDCNVWFVYLLAVFVDKFHVAADNHVYILVMATCLLFVSACCITDLFLTVIKF